MLKKVLHLIFALFFTLPFFACNNSENFKRLTFEGSVFGSITASFDIFSDTDDKNVKVMSKLATLFSKLDDALNTTKKNSEIYKFNKETDVNVPFEISVTFYDILEICDNYYEETMGYFNPAIYPLMELWKLTSIYLDEDHDDYIYERVYTPPAYDDVQDVLTYTDFSRDIDFYENDGKYYVVKTTDSRTELDFGGVAKGYAADKCAEIFEECGVNHGLIDISGNIYCFGKKNNKRAWYIRLGTPRPNMTDHRDLAVLMLVNESLVVSGDYQRYRVDSEGVWYQHIINPKSGMPSGVFYKEGRYTNISPLSGVTDRVCSAAIVGSSSTECEIFSTYSLAMASDAENGNTLSSAAAVLSGQNVKAVLNTTNNFAAIIGEILTIDHVLHYGIDFYTITEDVKQYGRLVKD